MAPQGPDTVPGGKVKVDLRATDALGRPVEAVFGVAATDDSVLSTIDPRERAARLPVQAMLAAFHGFAPLTLRPASSSSVPDANARAPRADAPGQLAPEV